MVPTFAFVNRILGVATQLCGKLSCGTVWSGGGASTVEVMDEIRSCDYIN